MDGARGFPVTSKTDAVAGKRDCSPGKRSRVHFAAVELSFTPSRRTSPCDLCAKKVGWLTDESGSGDCRLSGVAQATGAERADLLAV